MFLHQHGQWRAVFTVGMTAQRAAIGYLSTLQKIFVNRKPKMEKIRARFCIPDNNVHNPAYPQDRVTAVLVESVWSLLVGAQLLHCQARQVSQNQQGVLTTEELHFPARPYKGQCCAHAD